MRRDAYTPKKFWNKVKKLDTGCWEWQGNRLPKGYGIVCYRGRYNTGAHRIAWELTYGPIAEGLYVCHRCDNPPCCNPSHLFLGTAQDNMDDRSAKGRATGGSPPGERSGQARITEAQAVAILAKHQGSTKGVRETAREYGVSHVLILNVIRGKTWGYLPRPVAEPPRTAKLTTDDAAAIRAAFRPRHVTQAMLAQQYGVSIGTIKQTVAGTIWKE